MRSTLKLWSLRSVEPGQLRERLRDTKLAARLHRRYRVIEELRRCTLLAHAAERIGCHVSTVVVWGRRFIWKRLPFVLAGVESPRRIPVLYGAQLRALVEVAPSNQRERRPTVLLSEPRPSWPPPTMLTIRDIKLETH